VIDEPTTQIEDGPGACPFVAFEDDRDHRSSSPDYRHRCFAAAEPEPRAFPHQERYCLSAGFPSCPVFLDWARQEAAAVKAAGAAATPAAAAAIAGAAAGAAAEAATDGESAPAFLASRTRTVPDDAGAASRRAEASSTLWSYDTDTKRTQAKAAPPPPSSLGAPAVAMARRGPSHPGWENPPRLENFPRLRSREDRRANQPLLVVAVGMALVMVALIMFPIIANQKGGGIGNGGGNGGSSPSPSAIASAVDSEQPSPTVAQAAAPSLPDGWFSYRVLPGDFIAKIAQKFNLQVWEVEVANPQIHNFDILYVGWNLKIPPPGLLTPPPATAS
jgi:hypothetical protein